MSVRTGPHVNVPSFTPACKETAVRMTVLADKEESPLSRLNFRYCGKRTPQPGVEVERKWKRTDYRFPGQAELVQIQSVSSSTSI